MTHICITTEDYKIRFTGNTIRVMSFINTTLV